MDVDLFADQLLPVAHSLDGAVGPRGRTAPLSRPRLEAMWRTLHSATKPQPSESELWKQLKISLAEGTEEMEFLCVGSVISVRGIFSSDPDGGGVNADIGF